MKSSPVKGNSKRVFWIFGVVLVAIAGFAVFGNNGLVDVYKLGNERDAISEKTIRMQEENKALAAEIELLKTDNRYIAKVARDELGMIGKDEVLYKMDGEGK
ncbi:MAG: septum formation initiator family protein [Deltaproteobacteria bacterium]|nr:septum formation initiator family protein [Deltaproteobacteria bacterium]